MSFISRIADGADQLANLRRLIAVRWGALVLMAALVLLLPDALAIPLPTAPLLAIIGITALFNGAALWRARRADAAAPVELFSQLLVDIAALSALVFFSGGATNPFVSLMLVPVVIAAISLRPLWVWLLASVAGGYYALLLFYYQPLAVADPVAAYGMHLGGMWFNFLISAGLIAFFVTRMQAALRARDQELSALREKQLRDERIVALGTQAALAAHELATPLATIQTTAHELASEFANDPDIGEDCRLLERQAQACKAILTQLAARAQDSQPVAQPLDTWLAAVIERWQVLRPDARITSNVPPDHRDFIAPDGLEQAVLNVLNNAADASPDAVEFTAATVRDSLAIDIADRGPGFSPEHKAQAGRVLFSNKPGRGWGMGLALTHATLERLGGSLTLTERDGGGTRVRITLPWSPTE